MKKFLVEKNWGKGTWLQEGQYEMNAQVAKAIGMSPGKLANEMASFRKGEWNVIYVKGTAYRIGLINY